MPGAADEVSHRVVGRVAIGAGRIFGPAYGVMIGLVPRAVTGSELGEDTLVRPEQQLFDLVYWEGEWP